MPTAPNVLPQIRAVFAAHPEVNPLVDGERGQLTTYVVKALGGLPWGRKEKTKGTGVLSDDALCYRLADGRFEIYDIINGGSGAAGFDYAGTFGNGENGYFYEVPGTTVDQPPQPPPTSSTPGAQLDAEIVSLLKRIAAAETDLAQARSKVASFEARLVALEARPAGGTSINGARVALKTENGHYLCAEGGGGGEVNATRTGAGGWETLTLETK